jgi:hypothetical protein
LFTVLQCEQLLVHSSLHLRHCAACRLKDSGPSALKVVARPVIVGGRLFNLKEHPGTHGATQEYRLMAGIQPRKPSITNVTATDKTM